MRVTSGFGNMKKKQEQESARRLTGDFIPFLRLGNDREIARFRILSSHEEEAMEREGMSSYLISASFHRYSARSEKGNEYFRTDMCLKDEDEDGNLSGSCWLCDEEIARSLQFMVWVWVDYKLHANPDPGGKWPKRLYGSMECYQEDVSKFMIWQDGYFSQNQLEMKLAQYESLTDREYERVRYGAKGARGQIRYDLNSYDQSECPADILEKARELPNLLDVAEGRVATMDGRSRDEVMSQSKSNSSDGVAPAQVDTPAQQHQEVSRPASVEPSTTQAVDYDEEAEDLPF